MKCCSIKLAPNLRGTLLLLWLLLSVRLVGCASAVRADDPQGVASTPLISIHFEATPFLDALHELFLQAGVRYRIDDDLAECITSEANADA